MMLMDFLLMILLLVIMCLLMFLMMLLMLLTMLLLARMVTPPLGALLLLAPLGVLAKRCHCKMLLLY